jgi:basic membrane lipoprotein Med (substrate-binding protein (PBP1-ABC) superfamily)
MTEPKREWRKIKYYPVSIEKLQQASMREAAYLIAPVNIGEDYEYFDEVKHLLEIPAKIFDAQRPRKSIEELKQELDEKFEKLIEQYKRNSYASTLTTQSNYDWNFDRIIENFEYARENGYFPKVTFISSGTLDYSKLSVNAGSNISSPCFMVKHGSSHQGYYTIGDDGYYRFYMEKKPNAFFRFFVYKLMGFRWVDGVLK